MRKSLLILPLLFLPASACVVAAAGVGFIVGKEVTDDNTFVARINVDSARAWSQTKTTLGHASLKPLAIDESKRTVEAEVDGAQVKAAVETFDFGKSILKVSATKYGISNSETARMVFDRILSDLERNK